MGMGDVQFDIKEIFGKSISDGDFMVGMSGRGDISLTEYAIYTPYKTKFIINPILFPYEKDDRFKIYDNLDYSCFIENNFSFNKGNYYYKIENMDAYERSIYEVFKYNYEKRMESVDYYNSLKKKLPVGSIISGRNEFKPYLYLGKYSNYYILKENISDVKSYYIQSSLEDYHIFVELNYLLDKKFNFNDIISNNVNIVDIMNELSSSYFIVIKKAIPKNQFYLGYLDISPLLGNFESDNVYITNNITESEDNTLNSLFKKKENSLMFSYASYFKILLVNDN